jgi:hypothetical protein
MIDMHAFNEPNFGHWEGFRSGSAALRGVRGGYAERESPNGKRRRVLKADAVPNLQ